MKIKIKRKDALILKAFLGVTSTCDITDFCEQHGIKKGEKIDGSLYRLFKALDEKLNKVVEPFQC